jgi:hypothetical protein
MVAQSEMNSALSAVETAIKAFEKESFWTWVIPSAVL